MFANFLFFFFGLLLFFCGLALIFVENIIPPELMIEEGNYLPQGVMIFLGFLTFTGFLKNIIKGKNYVLEVSDDGIKINTGSLSKEGSVINIPWNNFSGIDLRYDLGVLRWQGGNRGWTKVIVIKVKKGSVYWPPVMIKRNMISFNKKDSHDEVVVNGWLNKSKKRIVKEIQDFTFNEINS